ncbi:MAG: UDP-N-acetylmuramate dehydrogenase [Salinivirgaceae bacterium]|jgi:UDP-N-acetylmuramate dehydrogenase|nr:UDP-N-acetylmuramate dehydrogenase [Salinivirgaceae bacterium]
MWSLSENVNIKSLHTFGIQHYSSALFCFTEADELITFMGENRNRFSRFFALGSGSNLLFTSNFPGCLLQSTNTDIEVISDIADKVLIKVGAGKDWDELVEWSVKNNLYGIENLSLIPGTVGASAVQNIGAYGVEVNQHITQVEGVNLDLLKLEHITKEACNYGYRDSIFKNELSNRFFITHVYYQLSRKAQFQLEYGAVKAEVEKHGAPSLKTVRHAIIDIRSSKLPDHTVTGNAGSFFKNPIIDTDKARELAKKHPNMPMYAAQKGKTKIAAGWLIDQCGLKGFTTPEGAGVHYKQALVLINNGVQNGTDILKLAQLIQKTVSDTFHIWLEPEVTILP